MGIGQIWDRTTLVLQGRGGALAAIAVPAIFLPAVVRVAVAAYVPASPANAPVRALVGIAVLLVSLWGHLAVVALSSDPAHLPAHARALATRRLLPAFGLLLLLGVAIGVLLLPPIVAIGSVVTPATLAAMQAGAMPAIPPGIGLFALLYLLAFALVLLVVGTRLFLLNAVIVNERLGVRAFRRSIDLTRGWTWRLIGLLILYLVVVGVAVLAAQTVVGVVARLILGADHVATATFLAGVAAAAVATAFAVVVAAFSAQLYLARRDMLPPR